jgi:hypothetical protein
MSKAAQGGVLIAVGIVLALGDFALYAYNRNQWDNDKVFRVGRDLAVGGDGTRTGSFGTTPYVVVAAIAALVVLCGVILYAADSSSPGGSSS